MRQTVNTAATTCRDSGPPDPAAPREDSAAPPSPPATPRQASPGRPGAAGRRTGRHRLAVVDVQRLTADAVAVTLDVPDVLRDVFAHRPGEHVVVRHRRADGAELRRSYSVCPPPADPTALRLVIRRGAPGGFGDHAVTGLVPGDVLELSPPTGTFALPEHPGGHHVLVGGGSGITPLAALAAAALREDPACRVSIVHSVPTAADALLADELAELKDAFVDRLTVTHVLTRESGSGLPGGRIDDAKLSRLLTALDALPGPDTTFALCGPAGMVAAVRRSLTEWGADPARIRSELFTPADESSADAPSPSAPPLPSTPALSAPAHSTPSPSTPPPTAPTPHGTRITALLDGRSRTVTASRDATVLDALLPAHPDVPYACREGICGSCRARVLTGRVTTGPQHALGAEEQAAGYTLVCRARPLSSELTLDFDV
ncbi:2Fe-2S iron-sulfur cluster-binding protein [Streptomyces sp. NPDC006610]|uniref:2Fe-2S iron-sulfur cluster-binding protein n=1 Tax=Streptomyces sp. NPDC006610 TaxID=3154584 RepID=UPI00339F2243